MEQSEYLSEFITKNWDDLTPEQINYLGQSRDEVAKLEENADTLKSLSKNLEMHVRTGNDTIEELHQQLTTAQALADGLHVTCQTLADQNAQSRQREARLRDVDRLASVFHDAWVHWAKTVGETEPISDKRLKRWATYFVPYKNLPEEVKELDREWARQGLKEE